MSKCYIVEDLLHKWPPLSIEGGCFGGICANI